MLLAYLPNALRMIAIDKKDVNEDFDNSCDPLSPLKRKGYIPSRIFYILVDPTEAPRGARASHLSQSSVDLTQYRSAILFYSIL